MNINFGNFYVGGSSSARTWGISSIFGSKASSVESPANGSTVETLHEVEQRSSTIQLSEVYTQFKRYVSF